MSLHIYSTRYPEQLSSVIFHSLLNRLPEGMQQKVLTFRRWQDAYGSLFGKLLLIRALKTVGHSGDITDLRHNSYGRPYLENGLDFNISHSGNSVVCMLSTQGRVGIDLEETNAIAIDDFRSQFTPAEWVTITGSANPMLTFYQYWTAKESLIKADGRGLQIGLDKLEIRGDLRQDSSVLLNGIRWYIRMLTVFPGYAAHIAYEHPIGPTDAEEVSPEQL
jgi:4'-phosphopantetheinyl transferase